jgi:hypothetical protein
MLVPFVLFWLLIYLGREDLGLKGVIWSVGTWTVLLAGFVIFSGSPYLFVAAQALLDVVLILVIFGGDVRIR